MKWLATINIWASSERGGGGGGGVDLNAPKLISITKLGIFLIFC